MLERGARGTLGASSNGDAALAAAATPAADLVGALLAEGDGAPPGRLAAAARLVGGRATERLLAWVAQGGEVRAANPNPNLAPEPEPSLSPKPDPQA